MAVSTRMQRLWLQSPSPPAAPVRFVSQCSEPDCATWTFGGTQHEAKDRMTVHRGQCHTVHPDNAAPEE